MARRPPRPNSPPQSERPGRGALIDPWKADYQRIGNTSTFRTPDRMMVVGTRRRFPAGEFGGGDFNLKKAARKRLSRGGNIAR